jgi:thiol-disulfide isomerase/thioredoxin/outer membrane lipoprotein-sorting protein
MARHAFDFIARFAGPTLGALGLAGAMLLTTSGCQETAAAPPATKPKAAAKTSSNDNADASKLLASVAEKYKTAKSYEDAGIIRIAVESEAGEKQQSPPMPFSVAFERPNKIRVHSLEASLVANGKKLYGSSDSLENEVLVQPCPNPLTVDKLFADKLLAESAQAQLDVTMPQLKLLLDPRAVESLTTGGKPAKMADADLDGTKCHRVSVKSPSGTAVLWISADDNLLVKYEFPSDGLKQKFSVAKCSLWAEFKGARIDQEIASDAFAFKVPEGAKLVKNLVPPPPQPPSALLGQAVDDFAFVDLKGKAVSRDSLKGKIAVLDMWATWCGWCFEGFPNLEKVYQQFKNNDKVVILAVNQDEPTVSDEQVQQSFEKKRLTIPIVRDSQQAGGKVLRVEGLPTMVILGSDGTIEDYHVGYDAQLAQTLPPKLKKLLSGESLAKEELEKYEQVRKEYEQKLSEVAVDDGDAQQ